MSFDWLEYYKLAQELVGESTTPASEEAKQRSAISRAYYAAFIKARNFLREEGVNIPQENAHQYVINQFKNSSEKVRKKVGGRLWRLRVDRNRADYNNTFPELAKKTQEALTLARRILSALESLE